MPSLIAWLDGSSDEQRRMREIIKLFSERDSRDELGIGSIRDGLSDALFPGTSTLLTRARYLLFVPWCYELAARKTGVRSSSDRFQLDLISAMKNSGEDYMGLIGVRAGEAIKTLPSTVYWSALRSYGILVDPSALERSGPASNAIDDLDGTGRPARAWSSTLPEMPTGFPKEIAGGFALSPDEAGWLRDRLLESAPGSLLAHLSVDSPDPKSYAPWLDAAALRAEGPAKVILDQARLFSTAILGAQLLYNLLLAEQHAALQPEIRAESDRVADFRGRLDSWRGDATLQDVLSWEQGELWALLAARGVRVPPRTRLFVDAWLTIIRGTPLAEVVDSGQARDFIHTRERVQKGPQARLGNPRRLQTWGGGSGDGQLLFRWGTVRRILLDIHEGLNRDA